MEKFVEINSRVYTIIRQVFIVNDRKVIAVIHSLKELPSNLESPLFFVRGVNFMS